MPSHEEIEEFFMNFVREMQHQGLFIMDNYKIDWPHLPTKDDIRRGEQDQQESDSDND